MERLVRTDAAGPARGDRGKSRKDVRGACGRATPAGMLPDDLNDKIRGFQDSRAILTALELDCSPPVGDGADGSGEWPGARVRMPRATEMLLNVLTSLELLVKRDGVFHNSPVAARYLREGSRDNARPALLHTAHLWHRWSTLTDCVRAGTAVPRDRRP